MNRLTTEEFVKRAINIHGRKYNYSKVKYINSETKVCIICPKHGEFYQKPSNHLSNKGCPKCGKEIQRKVSIEKMKKARLEFIKKAKSIHGDRYDYSKVNYIGAKTKVCIICPKHGEFYQEPTNHLSGNGCPKCSGKNRTSNEIIELFKSVHGNKYDYSNVQYHGYHTKVCIICPTHGEFWQTPANHLQGNGCPKCRVSMMESKVIKELNNKKIDFVYEYRPSFLINGKSHQSIDFYLPKHNIGIECQGKQHYMPIDFAGKGKKWANSLYKENVKRDKIKREICSEHGIKIFYIDYNEDTNKKLEKILELCNF